MNHDDYVAAKQAGLCPKCGAPAAKGKIYCPECAEKISFRQHINYIRRKFGVNREEALEIYREGEVQRFKREGHVLIKTKKKKTPPKPKQTLEEISKLAKEASESEQHYVSYGEMAARQSGAYDWKIGRKK